MEDIELQQTAVIAAPSELPQQPNTCTVRLGPRLHLSVEHAAIARMLDEDEMTLVLCLGRGMGDKGICEKLGIELGAARWRLNALRQRLRASRMSLGILGYQLLGQPEYTDIAA